MNKTLTQILTIMAVAMSSMILTGHPVHGIALYLIMKAPKFN
jgi:hypothetical protein